MAGWALARCSRFSYAGSIQVCLPLAAGQGGPGQAPLGPGQDTPTLTEAAPWPSCLGSGGSRRS